MYPGWASDFGDRAIELVRRIPRGKVATYGQIAALAGSPGAAVTVGGVLHRCQMEIPWQRVVNAEGFISTTCLEHPATWQASLLESEAVRVTRQAGLYRVDLLRYRWQPDE